MLFSQPSDLHTPRLSGPVISKLCNFICWKTIQAPLIEPMLDTWCMEMTAGKRACHLVLLIGLICVPSECQCTHNNTCHLNTTCITQFQGWWFNEKQFTGQVYCGYWLNNIRIYKQKRTSTTIAYFKNSKIPAGIIYILDKYLVKFGPTCYVLVTVLFFKPTIHTLL